MDFFNGMGWGGVFKEEECVAGWGHLIVRHEEGGGFYLFLKLIYMWGLLIFSS